VVLDSAVWLNGAMFSSPRFVCACVALLSCCELLAQDAAAVAENFKKFNKRWSSDVKTTVPQEASCSVDDGTCAVTKQLFRYYRLNVRSTNGANMWCFEEIRFYSSHGRIVLSGVPTASSSYFDITCGVDGHSRSDACHFCAAPNKPYPQWWEYDFKSPTAVSVYELETLRHFDALYMPRTWTFEGSDDKAMWTVLHKQNDYDVLSWGVRGSLHMFNCDGRAHWKSMGRGICTSRDTDFTRADEKFVAWRRVGGRGTWGLHPGLGWRHCAGEEHTDEECQQACDQMPGCRMVANSECCFMFKSSKCSVDADHTKYRMYVKSL